ncbi:MAG: GH3 auxin-responsive promoter family protein [Isosphaeraceae bacterium]|nr:GH3 auxin-responsive promoter family protein [Isosphaeraceae bacterium]
MASSPLTLLAGAPAIRQAVNAGFLTFARRRVRQIEQADPVATQEQTLKRLVAAARETRFGRDHRFGSIRTIADFQAAVPLRTYEDIWQQYFQDQYPILEDLTWPGRVPYLALTSGTTTGATKYIPVTRPMLASNTKAATTMLAFQVAAHPRSQLFRGKMFFLGGSTDLKRPGPGVEQGDLSGITAKTLGPHLRPYAFPPLELALDPDWDRKLSVLAERSLREPITLVSGVSSCLLALFQRLLELTGKANVAEVWPRLEVVVHGGVKFEPYREPFHTLLGSDQIRLQESYPCSEGFVAFGDPKTSLLRLVFDHGIFFEFVPIEELGSERPTRHWLGNAQTGINYAIVVSTCAGMWAHIIGDTVRFESLSPPLLTFTGRTKYTLSAFGEHLINEEIEGAIAFASEATGAAVRDWHVGSFFRPPLGYHQYVVEFLRPPADLGAFRDALDAELSRRNADYHWYRAIGSKLPAPAVLMARPGGFDDWMRSRGQLGGQHKVPRMDNTGQLTAELLASLRNGGRIEREVAAGELPARQAEGIS